MGGALKSFFQPVFDFFVTKDKTQQQPTVAGYKADYSSVSEADIASPAPCDEAFKTGNWVLVNRKS